MEVEGVIADSPCDRALLSSILNLISLAFNTYSDSGVSNMFKNIVCRGKERVSVVLTRVHDMVPADGTVINVDV